MASNLIKVLSIGGGVAGISAGGATTYFLLREKEKPISAFLAENKKILLSETNDPEGEQWNKNWEEFKKIYTENNVPKGNWEISGIWSTIFKEQTANKDFKNKCTINIEKKVKNTNNDLYKEVEKYCTKDA